MAQLTVFDPALCCSTGVCGTSVDPALARFAGDLRWLRARGVTVTRYNLAQEPGAFTADALVTGALKSQGMSCLPLLVADGRIASTGVYPDRAKLAEIAGVSAEDDGTPQPSYCERKRRERNALPMAGPRGDGQ
ncbi:MAG: arsenite efflux transporter metallochaperone ArsD [Planctomycetes bacterium]|nr:arsenite efflux transporter metallochaperone ArsD [Planctomycetota bacterium]